MRKKHKLAGVSVLVWAVFALLGLAMNVALSVQGRLDIYDIEDGLQFLKQMPLLVIGSHFFYGLAGATFVFTAVAFYEWLLPESDSYLARTSITFGIIAGTLFLVSGQIGSWGSVDLRYIQSMRSADYMREAYLPLALVVNRLFAVAISVSGFWFCLANLNIHKNKALPSVISYLGMGAGVLALSGLLLPGGGLGMLGFLLSIIWGILVGLLLLRR